MSKQEPVAAVQEGNVSWYRAVPKNGTLLYIHPAPSWQGLADFEIERMWMQSIKEKGIGGEDWVIGFARAIEQALRERNCNDTK